MSNGVRRIVAVVVLIAGAVLLWLARDAYKEAEAAKTELESTAAYARERATANDPRLRGAYSFERGGWVYAHLEGEPAQIGFQHGFMLAQEIEDGFAAGDRKRVESSNGPLGIFLQVVEIRSIVAVGNAIQNAEMKFQRFFDLIENPSEEIRVDVAGHCFHLPVTEEVDIELRPQLFQSLGERHAVVSGIRGDAADGQVAGEKLTQNGAVVG